VSGAWLGLCASRAQFRPSKVKEVNMHVSSPGPTVVKGKSKDQIKAEEEAKAATVSKAGGFKNHPDNPRNPNEVRERHLTKIKENVKQ
jgi:hypothetical protein